MAKLEAHEKEALLRHTKAALQEPPLRKMTPAQYVSFATQTSRFLKPRKFHPIQGGAQWKL